MRDGRRMKWSASRENMEVIVRLSPSRRRRLELGLNIASAGAYGWAINEMRKKQPVSERVVPVLPLRRD